MGEGSGFVHLHVHTQYSLLEGAIRIPALLERASSLGMAALAITDTHNLFGSVDFYLAAQAKGIRPILGCEIQYVHDRSQKTESAPGSIAPKAHHLVLLCKNLAGYRNLCRMLTESYLATRGTTRGAKAGAERPVVDWGLLDRLGDGLVVLSGCLRGEISWRALQGDEAGARELVEGFQKRFGEDFYLEIQDTGIPEQNAVNDVLAKLGHKLGVRLVATADCHYLNESDAEAHEVLQCIAHGRNLDFDRPKSLVPSRYHFASPAEMRARFARFEGACDETLRIADKCRVEFKFKDDLGNPITHLPLFRPDGVAPSEAFDLAAFFTQLAREGLERRLHGREANAKEYKDRLEQEIAMILKTGFAGYFLIVADFINWAKSQTIPVGPGRGSGAGSLVAYSLRITDIDPLKFNLLFERFINPERVSLPDFDVDFCQDRRGEVINYVMKKYGSSNVSQIITFGKLQARAVIKDVGRVLGLSFAETDEVTKLMPKELNITIGQALEASQDFQAKVNSDPKLTKVMEYAQALEGLYRNAGIHAAGVIITERPIVEYCPLFVGKDGDLVTQLDKDFSEKIGLVKFDFLGLKTLTVIDYAVKLVRQGPTPDFVIEDIPTDDPQVFALIGTGETDGVFQIESSGMKDLCTRIQPGTLEDLTAINALFRPGPLGSGMVDDFINCKQGRNAIAYDLPALEPILNETYGVILYQEQVMQIARELAGYSLGQADMLRRAMGKKKPEEMAKQREVFIKGALERGVPEGKAGSIFDLMAKFAEYGFNKSHSAAYAMISYQTAYLKAHYPSQFMAALMTTEMSDTDKLARYIADAKARGTPVLPPDVNRSMKRFSVESVEKNGKVISAIRFGLEAIKGVGGIAVDTILEARAGMGGTNEPFRSVVDFTRRVASRKANKKVLEALVLSGAFDSIAEHNRATIFESLERVIQSASDEQEERALGQASLFDAFDAQEIKIAASTDTFFKPQEDWPLSKKLAQEKQVVGFYVSGHPLEGWQKLAEDWLGWNTDRIKNRATKQAGRAEVKLVALVTGLREIVNRKGARMAFVQLEDLKGKIEAVFFSDAYEKTKEMLKRASEEAEPILVVGDLENRDDQAKILAREAFWAADAHRIRMRKVIVELKPERVSVEQLRGLKKCLLDNRGKCPVSIRFQGGSFSAELALPTGLRVSGSPELVQAVNQIFDAEVVSIV